MDMEAELIRRACPDAAYVAGGETAGIPYAAFLSDRLDLPMLYIRKKPKGFGRMSQIEGFMDEADLWVNPDCGLKTRSWEEIERQLADMVAAARARREAVTGTSAAVATPGG